ncbi:MAG: LysM peptidoglycan-binding domain-containing protein [Chloroflexota bacterium]|nr:LysM peptidoglycan-binding domain-containing protein [Chloroflexota bacterium]
MLAIVLMLLCSCGQVVTRATEMPAPTPTATVTATLVPIELPSSTPAPYTAPPTATPTITPTPVIYKIQAGENLHIIASRFGVPHDLLRDVNGIVDERALQVGQELIIPLGGISGPIEPTETPTPTPLPMKVKNVYFHPNPVGGLSALGEVINTSTVELEQVLVQMRLFDNQDRPLIAGDSYTMLDVVAPGQRAPFVIRFSDVPASFATFQTEVLSAVPAYIDPIHMDLQPRGVTLDQPPRQPLRLHGRIANVGSHEAVAVIAVATLYDPLGRVVGARIVEPVHNVVARGGETLFDVELVPAGPVFSYTVQAQGRRLIPTPLSVSDE